MKKEKFKSKDSPKSIEKQYKPIRVQKACFQCRKAHSVSIHFQIR